MKPIQFKNYKGLHELMAKDQDEYLTLPVVRDADGIINSCWVLTFRERLKILFTATLYLQIMTFGAKLQPQKPTVDNPLIRKDK